jgi:hypothetical protein
MRRLFLILTLLGFFTSFVKGQNNGPSCEELQGIIANPMFNEWFDFLGRNEREFVIIDTIGIFSKCKKKNRVKGRVVTIVDTIFSKEGIAKNLDYVIVITGREECVFSIGFLSHARGRIFVANYLIKGEAEQLRFLGYKFGDF